MMNGSAKYSDLGTTAAVAAVVVPAVVNNNNDEARVLLVATATATPVVTPTLTERVEVIAPASLPGGYELHCDFQGRSVVVRVVRIVMCRCICI
jgi:hypothetical protein